MHDPGAPPQWPQVGGAEEVLPLVVLTAKTLIDRVVLVDPHFGHGCLPVSLIDFTSFSNFVSQSGQVYS